MKNASFYILLIISLNVNSQTIWNDHLSYSAGQNLAISEKYTYCATPTGIIKYNKLTDEISKLSKVNGLSDIGITSIAFNETYNCLIISYYNGNVDIVIDNELYNFSEYKNLISINNVFTIGKGVYFATDKGVLLFNLQYKIFIELCQFNVEVNDITEKENIIYVATKNGIFYSNKNYTDLDDFLLWNKILFLKSNYNHVVSFNNTLYAISDNVNSTIDTLIGFDNLSYSQIYTGNFNNLKISNNKLITVETDRFNVHSNTSTITFADAEIFPKDVLYVNDSIYWIADRYKGLVKSIGSNLEKFTPNSPNNSKVVSISIQGNNLWAAPGGKTGSWTNLFSKGELHTFFNSNWLTLDTSNVNGMPVVKDIVKVIVNPKNPSQTFAASWGYGILEFNNKDFVNLYNENNSSLQDLDAWDKHVRIYGLAFDESNNLWVTNSGVANAISVKTPDNNWYGLQYYNIINTSVIGDIIVTKTNNKWVVLPRGIGLFAFNEKGTFENIADDDVKKFSILDENNQIITNDVFSIAEDKEGQIWVGTNKGIVVYKNPENVFSGSNFYAKRIKSTIDTTVYILQNETITAIVIDSINQKWIGTESSGVYLMSADLTKEIHHYTFENSPLISNRITSIAINENTDEIYFGTYNGIVSFVKDSDKNISMLNQNEILLNIFPNPATNEVTFLFNDLSLPITGSLRIFNANGSLVKDISINDEILKLNVSTWRSGIYYCFFSTNNKKTLNKFIITK